MKRTLQFVSLFAATGLVLGASLAAAQTDHKSHHPDATSPAAEAGEASDMSSGQTMGGATMGGGMMGSKKSRGGMMGMMAGGCPMMGAMMGDGETPSYSAGRIAFLKAELAITDTQQKVWDAYAEALKHNLQGMQDMHKTMMTAMMGKTPVEKLDAHVTAMESHLTALKEIKPALAALYEALSPDQRKKADGLLTGMGCMT